MEHPKILLCTFNPLSGDGSNIRTYNNFVVFGSNHLYNNTTTYYALVWEKDTSKKCFRKEENV